MQANESIYDFDALDALDYNADDWDKLQKYHLILQTVQEVHNEQHK